MQRDSNRYLLSDSIYDAGVLLVLYQRRLDLYVSSPNAELEDSLASLRVHMVNNIVRSLKEQYDFFFKYVPTKEHYVFALLLDRRFCNLDIFAQVHLYKYNRDTVPADAMSSVKNLVQQYRQRLLERCTEAHRARLPPLVPAQPRASLKRKSTFFDNEDLLDSTAPVAPAPAEAEAEPVALAVLAQWNAYLVYEGDLPDFPLLFWPSYMNEAPDLGHVAEIYTGIKHSQVKVEGLFSVTGHLTLDRRSRTGVERLDDICYIWSNYPRTPKPPGKESEASRNQAIVLPEFFPDEQPDWADSPAGEFDEAAALQENEALAEVDVGQNGYADLPDHLDTIFDVGTDLDGLKEVDLDLDDLGYESVLFADLDQMFLQ